MPLPSFLQGPATSKDVVQPPACGASAQLQTPPPLDTTSNAAAVLPAGRGAVAAAACGASAQLQTTPQWLCTHCVLCLLTQHITASRARVVLLCACRVTVK
jgi:hypothetical protein